MTPITKSEWKNYVREYVRKDMANWIRCDACDRKAPRDMIVNRQTFNYCALCHPEYFKQEQLKAWGILE